MKIPFKLLAVAAPLLLATTLQSVAATLTVGNVNCGTYSNMQVDGSGNVSITINDSACVTNTGGTGGTAGTGGTGGTAGTGGTGGTAGTGGTGGTAGTGGTGGTAGTGGIDGGSGSNYPIAITQAWGALSGNIIRKASGMESYVWRANTQGNSVGNTGAVTAFATTSGAAMRTISISTTPNTLSTINSCTRFSTSSATLQWAIVAPNSAAPFGSCPMVQGTTYYINVSHQQYGSSTCNTTGGCSFYLENKINY